MLRFQRQVPSQAISIRLTRMPTSVEPVRLEVTARNARPTLVRRCNTANSPRTAIIVNVIPTLSCHSRAPPMSQRPSTVCGKGENQEHRPPTPLFTNKCTQEQIQAQRCSDRSHRVRANRANDHPFSKCPYQHRNNYCPENRPTLATQLPPNRYWTKNFIYGLGPVANTNAI